MSQTHGFQQHCTGVKQQSCQPSLHWNGHIYSITKSSETSTTDYYVLQGLDLSVKNFLTSVPLVADLRSPAMRERHWSQLMTTTKVQHRFVQAGTAPDSDCLHSKAYGCCRAHLTVWDCCPLAASICKFGGNLVVVVSFRDAVHVHQHMHLCACHVHHLVMQQLAVSRTHACRCNSPWMPTSSLMTC